MPFTDDLDSELVDEVTAAYKNTAAFLPFKEAQIKAVFSPEEVVNLDKLLADMKAATNANDKLAKLLKYPTEALKLLQLAKIV